MSNSIYPENWDELTNGVWTERKKRNSWWAMLRACRDDFRKLMMECIELREEDFYYFLEQNYGLRVRLEEGNIGPDYDIVDEGKHLLFVLRYSK